MRRILYLRSTSDYIAGPERVILELAAPLRARGYEIALLALTRRDDYPGGLHPFVREARLAGLEAEQLVTRAQIPLEAYRRAAYWARAGGCALVHSHEHKTNPMALWAARRARALPVATVHGYERDLRRYAFYTWLDLRVLRLFPCVISVSEAAACELARAGLTRVRVVHNGLDLGRFAAGASAQAAALKASGELPASGPLVMVVGRLAPDKGHSDVLAAWPEVLKQIPSARLVFVGEGAARPALEAEVGRRGLDKSVHLLGNRYPVAPYLAAADLVVMPSRREALGYVLLEAMALSKPIVAAEVGGIPEVLGAGTFGWLVKPGSAADYAAAIVDLLRDAAEAARLGRAARAAAEKEYTAAQMADGVASVYDALLGSGSQVKRVGEDSR